jgi:hypothetical protein
MYEEDELERPVDFGMNLLPHEQEDEYHSMTTNSEDRIYTEESVESQEFQIDLDKSNNINPIKVDRFKIEK